MPWPSKCFLSYIIYWYLVSAHRCRVYAQLRANHLLTPQCTRLKNKNLSIANLKKKKDASMDNVATAKGNLTLWVKWNLFGPFILVLCSVSTNVILQLVQAHTLCCMTHVCCLHCCIGIFSIVMYLRNTSWYLCFNHIRTHRAEESITKATETLQEAKAIRDADAAAAKAK